MEIMMLGVGDLGASSDPNVAIKTMALGSCVSLIIFDPVYKVIGMDHIALPESKINLNKAKQTPGYFVDTGIPKLIEEMKKKGMKTPLNKLVIKLVGGARVIDLNNTFNIGKRNVLAIKKMLWKYGMGARAEDVAGTISRTVTVYNGTGVVKISAPNREDWEI